VTERVGNDNDQCRTKQSEGSTVHDPGTFREAIKRDLRGVADYGADHTYTVRNRMWQSLRGNQAIPPDLEDVLAAIVNEEWNWWVEEGPIE
jgi:hypothetical protein